MKAVWKGAIIAESDQTVVVEGNHYFPPNALNHALVRSSDYSTMCGWKGRASYYDIVVDNEVNKDAAWYYPQAKEGAKNIEGVALGGGEGIGGSLWGPSVDSVLGIDVVSTWQNNTADWDIVHINATNEPDLFWGMLLQLHPLPVDGILTGVTVIWPLPLGVEAFQMYNDWLADAPEELSTAMALATTPVGQVAMSVSLTGTPITPLVSPKLLR
ncbi:TPA: hypothetical protein ACH3X1_014511 [Trebouxia sp. C0004]